jgi:hypothetical protein
LFINSSSCNYSPGKFGTLRSHFCRKLLAGLALQNWRIPDTNLKKLAHAKITVAHKADRVVEVFLAFFSISVGIVVTIIDVGCHSPIAASN